MTISPSSVAPSVPLAGQGVFDQPNSPEQGLRVRVSQSERKPAVIANNEKIPGFFERIADSFQSWKERRAETALNSSAKIAALTISHGLMSGHSKTLYQGLKKLHNVEQKFPGKGEKVSAKVKAAVVTTTRAMTRDVMGDKLLEVAKDRDGLIARHSDRNTLFHRVLEGLEKIGLVTKKYMRERNDRITALDENIKESILSIQRNYYNNKICEESYYSKYRIYDACEKLIRSGHENATMERAIKRIADNVSNSENPFDKYRLSLSLKMFNNHVNEKTRGKFDENKLLRESIADGCLEAEYYSACRIENENTSKTELFKKLSEKGHVEAQYKLAEEYSSSEDNEKEGVKLYKQLADIGHLDSMRVLLDRFENQISIIERINFTSYTLALT